jgi:hypothetical protein
MLYTEAKLLDAIFGITFVTAWANLALLLPALILMFGLGCQSNQQGRGTTNTSCYMSTMFW